MPAAQDDKGLRTVLVEPPPPDGTAHPRLPAPEARMELGDGSAVSFRQLQPSDREELVAAHREMFPVDYEAAFFDRVVGQRDGLESLAAVSRHPDGGSARLAGFVTARAFRLRECDPADRALLGLGHRLLDEARVMYLLTLGVTDAFRQHGIASALVRWVVRRAQQTRCRAVYLHVIDYNSAAIGLYRRNGFAQVACRERFYCILSGRQPQPERQVYDAFLYARVLDDSHDTSLANLLLLAFAPLRRLLASLAALLPWAEPRGCYFGGGELLPLPPPPGAAGKLGPVRRSAPAAWLLALFSRKGAGRQR